MSAVIFSAPKMLDFLNLNLGRQLTQTEKLTAALQIFSIEYHPPSLFILDNIKLDGMPTRMNEKITHCVPCISNFEGTSL